MNDDKNQNNVCPYGKKCNRMFDTCKKHSLSELRQMFPIFLLKCKISAAKLGFEQGYYEGFDIGWNTIAHNKSSEEEPIVNVPPEEDHANNISISLQG